MDAVTQFKQAMGNYPTGVTVVTAQDTDGNPIGMTVNSFASVSIDPLLILWSIDKNAFYFDAFTKATSFNVNILAADQGDLCMLFASRVEDRFGKCEWHPGENGLAVLKGTASQLECTVYKTVDAGDHMILIGEVTSIHNEEKEPLLYHKRLFGKIPDAFYQQS
ncbi:flavin reductase family protein [Chryseomicrobium sp. FSL W7-1435]|uniref:flavin reductase family protein n=1 Tax=Chryseomicrobium sp. FSL W7-1435 TaxID=2921704 RepID=UPI00315B1743